MAALSVVEGTVAAGAGILTGAFVLEVDGAALTAGVTGRAEDEIGVDVACEAVLFGVESAVAGLEVLMPEPKASSRSDVAGTATGAGVRATGAETDSLGVELTGNVCGGLLLTGGV